MIVTLTTRALRQLDEISDYIARDNPDRAITFARELYAHCHALADFPERNAIVAQHRRRKVHKAGFGDYLIFYFIAGQRIEVFDILHSARDWPRLIRP